MRAITGVFNSADDAARAVQQLVPLLGKDRINVLAPGASHEQVHQIPKTDDMPPVGRTLWASMGATLGLGTGFVLPSLLIPGVGFVTAIGTIAGFVLGLAGGITGWKVGAEADRSSFDGIPADELFIYEDALRKGRTVVIAFVEHREHDERVEVIFKTCGAETVDAAEKAWLKWVPFMEASRYEVPSGEAPAKSKPMSQ